MGRVNEMTYIILKSKKDSYHKTIVYIGFLVLEKHYKTLLQYAREMPYMPLQPEEIISDLIIDRMPRFVRNFRSVALDEVRDCLELDLDPARDEKLFRHNVLTLRERFYKLQTKNILLPDEKKRLKMLKKQINYLHKLRHLCKVEKKLLAYMRSCIRRTKIKYLQTMVQSTEGRTTYNADPTNGLLEVPGTENHIEESYQIAEEELKSYGLEKDEEEIIRLALIHDSSYPEISRETGLSRTAAARKYKEAMVKLLRKVKEK